MSAILEIGSSRINKPFLHLLPNSAVFSSLEDMCDVSPGQIGWNLQISLASDSFVGQG